MRAERAFRRACLALLVFAPAACFAVGCGGSDLAGDDTGDGATSDGAASQTDAPAPSEGDSAVSTSGDSGAATTRDATVDDSGPPKDSSLPEDSTAPDSSMNAADSEAIDTGADVTTIDAGHDSGSADTGMTSAADADTGKDAGSSADATITDSGTAIPDAAKDAEEPDAHDASEPDAFEFDSSFLADAHLPFDASGDGPVAACADCLSTDCAPAVEACASDPSCSALFECSIAEGCLAAGQQNSNCLSACITDAGLTPKETLEAITLLEGLAACGQCTSACGADSGH